DRRRVRNARTDYINRWPEKTRAGFGLLRNRRLDFGRRTIVSARRSLQETALTPVPEPARPCQPCDAGVVLNSVQSPGTKGVRSIRPTRRAIDVRRNRAWRA